MLLIVLVYYLADYGFPIHYRDTNNEWADCDNTLKFNEIVDSNGINGYVNNLSDVNVKFTKDAKSSNLLKLTLEEYKISIGLVSFNDRKSVEVYSKQAGNKARILILLFCFRNYHPESSMKRFL